ncbi:MAG: CBS domain-containing protein [Acidimicrobiales bacterium]
MKVEGILKEKGHEVQTTAPEADLRVVLHKLSTLGIGSLVVSADGLAVQGTISERDIVRGLYRHGEQFLELRVQDVMSRNGPTCSPSDTLQHVMAVMTRTRHRHLPVVDDQGQLCGVVSIGDVVKHRLSEMELERDVLRDAYVTRR